MRTEAAAPIGSSLRRAPQRLVARFEGSLAAYVGAAVLVVGTLSTYWDVATHVDVGRERFLTPAHVGLYASVLVTAIAIALSGLADHFRAGDSFLSALRHPFTNLRPGIGVAGAGMLTALVAAPFDSAWHEIYGIDVTIWSPPHLLGIFGVAAATLGLAALVAPAATRRHTVVYPVLLAAFLTALLVTTGEFEFNTPQYRIAYHPVILAAASALVFTAAAGVRWRATTVALWFEGVRLASLLFLFVVGRSLAFVPFVVPAALVADLIGRRRSGLLVGGAVAATTVLSNWVVLELLNGLRWPPDDLLLAAPFALIVGALAGSVGSRLGRRLDGVAAARTTHDRRRTGIVATLLVSVVAVVASPAQAHEVGGRRGTGVVAWSPAVPEAGQPVTITIEDLSLDSGARLEDLQIEAWRAEHRIRAGLDIARGRSAARITLPEEGPWFLFVRASAGGERLLWSDRFTVAPEGLGQAGERRRRFTLGLDTLEGEEPPASVDVLAYGIAIGVMLLLGMGVVRAVRRLPGSDSQVRAAT